ncbi:MAG: alpha/beta fold hydrolase [Dehalococcoidia bacterium]|nr:MAG: alpha/beta fold hydrolase [Dehalococcoidia bacterium]
MRQLTGRRHSPPANTPSTCSSREFKQRSYGKTTSSGPVERTIIEVDGLRLNAEVHYPGGLGPHPALCICHGVPAKRTPDPTDRGYGLLAEKYSSHGFVTLIFNFRGSGESEGNFDIVGWTRDLKAATDYLYDLDKIDRSRLSLMGFSGGAATVIYCAARDQRVSSVVSCACPARFFDISEFSMIEEFLGNCRQVGIIRDSDFPPSVEEWAQGFAEVSPLNWIDRIAPRPIFIVHGANDETINPSHAQRLYEKAGKPKDIAIMEGGVHKLRLSEAAVDAALSWLKKVNGLAESS